MNIQDKNNFYSHPHMYNEYPPISGIEISYIQSVMTDISTEYVFPFFRTSDNLAFIDVYCFQYIQSTSNYSLKRYVIHEGTRLSQEEECAFLCLIRNKGNQVIDKACSRILSQIIAEVFPHWHYFHGMYQNDQKMLEHFYFASLHSGAQKILIKADLNRIALELDKIEHNNEETTPEKIIGLPLDLLRILNQCDDFVTLLFSADSINQCIEIYHTYEQYFAVSLPSIGQWKYLLEIHAQKGIGGLYGFQPQLYNELNLAVSIEAFNIYVNCLNSNAFSCP